MFGAEFFGVIFDRSEYWVNGFVIYGVDVTFSL